jgi:hypothetical protein
LVLNFLSIPLKTNRKSLACIFSCPATSKSYLKRQIKTRLELYTGDTDHYVATRIQRHSDTIYLYGCQIYIP